MEAVAGLQVAAQVDDIPIDLDVEAVTGLQAELPSRFAGDGDLVLGADLDAKHVHDDKQLGRGGASPTGRAPRLG
jgi:hypothetical protein